MPEALIPRAKQSNLMPALSDGINPYGRVTVKAKKVKEFLDINDMLEDQDHAEVEALMSQMSMRSHREGRQLNLSAYD